MTIADKIQLLYDEEYIRVVSPRNWLFANRARRLRGKWDKKESCWIFDSSLLEYVREAMIEAYGTTGESPYTLVNLIVSDYSYETSDSSIGLLGYPIMYNNNYGSVKQEEGVVVLSGKVRTYRGEGVSVNGAEIMLMGLPDRVVDTPAYKELEKECGVRVEHRKRMSKQEYLEDVLSKSEKLSEGIRNELERERTNTSEAVG